MYKLWRDPFKSIVYEQMRYELIQCNSCVHTAVNPMLCVKYDILLKIHVNPFT